MAAFGSLLFLKGASPFSPLFPSLPLLSPPRPHPTLSPFTLFPPLSQQTVRVVVGMMADERSGRGWGGGWVRFEAFRGSSRGAGYVLRLNGGLAGGPGGYLVVSREDNPWCKVKSAMGLGACYAKYEPDVARGVTALHGSRARAPSLPVISRCWSRPTQELVVLIRTIMIQAAKQPEHGRACRLETRRVTVGLC
eukprot:3398139-Rhodomonas_salina.2